jgi:eukaryotic-like serine/threonine-protein kinase
MLTTGTRLGPYEIAGELGAGAMGRVYRAHDTRLGRDVAIKVLVNAIQRPAAMGRFEAEARAAGSLSHPNVMAIHDVGIHDGEPYIVSELLEGKNLREFQRGQPLPLRTVIDLARQLAKGVAAAHERGLIHRDLKPENLFVTETGQLKVLDFGLAKLTSEENPRQQTLSEDGGDGWLNAHKFDTISGAIIGTIGYMAPEQVRGLPADRRSDVFSIGAVIHELVTGHRLFQRPTQAEVGWAIVHDEAPELEPPAPPELRRIVERCLRKKARNRFQSASDLAFALEAPLTATVSKPVQRISVPPAILRRAGWVVTIALAGTALALLFAPKSHPQPPAYKRLTFGSGRVTHARFTADGTGFVFSAAWQGQPEITYLSRLDSTAPFPFRDFGESTVYATSRNDEVLLGTSPRNTSMGMVFTLAQGSAGTVPRILLDKVTDADWGPDGRSIAAAHVVADGTDLEYPIGHLLWHSGQTLDAPRVSPAGDRIAVMQWTPGLHSIWAVDLKGKRTVLVEDVKGDGFAWSPSGKELWFMQGQELRAVDLSGGQRVIMSFPGTVYLLDISPAGRILIAQGDARKEMARIPLSDAGRPTDYSRFDETSLVDLSSDGSAILFQDKGGLFLRSTNKPAPSWLGNYKAWRGFDPNAAAVLAVDDTGLVAIWTEKGGARFVPLGGLTPLNAQFLPDGKRIAVVAIDQAKADEGKATRLYLATLEGNPVRLSDAVVSPQSWIISPKGDFVVAALASGNLELIPIGPGRSRPLAAAISDAVPVGFLDDSTLILVSQSTLAPALYKLDLRSGSCSFWRNIQARDPSGIMRYYHFIVSRDGKQLAFDYYRHRADLYLVDGLQ